jgi:2Fe-2S ferredoxin
MPQVIFIHPDNQETTLDIQDGWTVMEGARQAGIEGIVAECGGGAICGTCHVQVDAQWAESFAEPDMSEAALLEVVPERVPTSRLACQLVLDDAQHEGLRVRIPSEQISM